VVLALVVALAAPAGAATTSTAASAARRKQAEVRAQKAKAAAKLNALKASDDELEKAVNALTVQVRAQNAKVASARQAVAVADAQVKQTEDKIASTEAAMTGLQTAVVDRAVASYVRPPQSTFAGLSGAKSLEDASRRIAMQRQVTNNDRDVIDELRSTREDLDVDKAKAAAAREVAAKRRAAADQQLASYKSSLAEKDRMQKALDARIAEVTAEIEATARADAAIQALINSDQARARSAARASRGGDVADSRVGGLGLRWPASGPVTSEFGYRWGRLHAGIDIGAGYGAPIHAAKDGVVIFAGVENGYGNCVIIDHGGGLTTLYGHQSRIVTSDGADVSAGEVIGYVGSTGHSTGPHLHFETRIGGTPENPRRYLP
jgi:murein DD-endopeptidase MepM/ murein hydrolase activator NlpD